MSTSARTSPIEPHVTTYAPTLPSWTVTSADGVEIAVYEFGGAGVPLLLAHATGFCATMYRPLGVELVDRFRIVALDFRGHGRSVRPPNDDFGWGRMAQDVLAVVERLDSPMAGFGHSMGGAALLLAEEQRPGTFESLFLFEPIVLPDDFSPARTNYMAELARGRRSTFPSRDEASARYASRPPLNTMRADVLKAYIDDGFVDLPDGSVRLACKPDDEASTFESETKLNVSKVTDVTTPVAVAVGHDEEGPNPARLGPGLVAALPNAELIQRPGLGHLGPFQDPALVAADVRAHADRPMGV
ncbi:MAG: putative hydrolase [Desertimonas sp.]|nr:putative hydrolase [Desertimonas sp.]